MLRTSGKDCEQQQQKRGTHIHRMKVKSRFQQKQQHNTLAALSGSTCIRAGTICLCLWASPFGTALIIDRGHPFNELFAIWVAYCFDCVQISPAALCVCICKREEMKWSNVTPKKKKRCCLHLLNPSNYQGCLLVSPPFRHKK